MFRLSDNVTERRFLSDLTNDLYICLGTYGVFLSALAVDCFANMVIEHDLNLLLRSKEIAYDSQEQ
ncbi:hypothetical protein MAR_035642 [Mya arenaria]|uniref:Uncharacterized protein n=1 Tax=Mya arenaria TaxID=6604 RepID=A0ABY7EPB1_MYAAR|nr:hypothetical protein MAR_035642 [Mya arenaria]